MSCFFETAEGCALTFPLCEGCTNCIITNGSTCGCETACENCFDEAVSGVSCIREQCPGCR
ncbi:MAG: hypothetical protein AB8I08_36375 [Sandaracinaceae bacterium]